MLKTSVSVFTGLHTPILRTAQYPLAFFTFRKKITRILINKNSNDDCCFKQKKLKYFKKINV